MQFTNTMELVSGVLVRISGADPAEVKHKGRAFFHSENGMTTLSCSGSLVWNGLESNDPDSNVVHIISSGSIFAPFLKPIQDRTPNSNMLLPGTRVSVCCETTIDQRTKWVKARLEQIIQLDAVATQITRSLGGEATFENNLNAGSLVLLSCKRDALPKIHFPKAPKVVRPKLCQRGDQLEIQSSPFGLVSPEMFHNTVTTGVVCNMIPCGQSFLILTDARCLPGSEGAPVWNTDGNWIGVVAPVLKRQDSSVLELSVVIPVQLLQTPQRKHESQACSTDLNTTVGLHNEPVRSKAIRTKMKEPRQLKVPTCGGVYPQLPISKQEPMSNVQVIRDGRRAVALVQVGGSWGSGVAISSNGYLVTCAHVLLPHMVFNGTSQHATANANQNAASYSRYSSCCSRTVYVSFRDDELLDSPNYTAQVVYCSQGAMDIALLRLDQVYDAKSRSWRAFEAGVDRIHSALVQQADGQVGESVYALGFPLFAPSSKLGMTVTRGTLAKSIRGSSVSSRPLVLQTSAPVFGGHSGGLLLDSSGRALGILTSNARHADGSIIPTINFSIPFAALGTLLEQVTAEEQGLGNLDVEILRQEYDSSNEILERLLNLQSLDDLHQAKLGDNQLLDQDGTDILQSSQFGDFIKQFQQGDVLSSKL